MLDGLTHLALELVQVAQFTHGRALSCRLTPRTVPRSLMVKEEGLIDLAEVAAYVSLHFVCLDACAILSQNGVAQSITPIRITEFVLDLGQNQKEC